MRHKFLHFYLPLWLSAIVLITASLVLVDFYDIQPAKAAGGALVAHTFCQSASTGCTTPAINTTGSTLLVIFVSKLQSATVTVSDSKNNTWTGATEACHTTGGSDARIWYVNSVTPTTDSAQTFTISAVGSFPSLYVETFSGSLTSPFDTENNNCGGPAITTITTGSITPGANGEIIVSAISLDGTGPTSIDSGLAITDSSSLIGGTAYGGGAAYYIQNSKGAINPTWTFGSGSPSAAIVAFKATAPPTTDAIFFAGD